MGLDVVPFEGRLVEPAAVLLAGGRPDGAPDLADPAVARRLVAAWQGTGPAVAAVEGGELVGFLAASVDGVPGPQRASVRLQQHAAVAGRKREVYRRLYSALAGELAAVGRFEHTIAVPAADGEVTTALFELGFGIDQIKGLRSARASSGEATRLREAGPADLRRLLELTVELQQFHATSPILRPALLDVPAIRNGFLAALGDDRHLILVAEEHGHVVGMMQAEPDKRNHSAAVIGIASVSACARSRGLGTALLAGVSDWAARRGFANVAAGWSSANPVSDAFWRGRGFTPIGYTLTRLIDARVAWAGSGLSYAHHLPDGPALPS
ncbi:GNAT family N-acetyltransferase [Streptomyces sp. SP17BM10]|uniref:GNAT family N-acetyltransferase n=1 Tax=Streptomyces sp. SP17BM10 TaxID=3002530 RepID=UPI002E7995FC|nr:GNAT family N-acetyltransferase [Streptomyces sp. SP17BM10]MEE1786180.1 GNAT family N-acetyltransferase [Streptomyces sp. SP17BM10]